MRISQLVYFIVAEIISLIQIPSEPSFASSAKLAETIAVGLNTFLLQEFLNDSYLFWRKASDITVFID